MIQLVVRSSVDLLHFFRSMCFLLYRLSVRAETKIGQLCDAGTIAINLT